MGEGRPGPWPRFGMVADCLTMAAVSSISSSVWRIRGFREEDFDDEGLL
jgi:hypothetical protein